jgi:PAS domain S-box-containing protein
MNMALRSFTGLFTCLVLLWSSILPAGQGQSASSQRPLVIASTNNFPPINMLDEEDRLIGFGRDMADAVAAELGRDVQHIHTDIWTDVLAWLDQGKADVIHDTGYTPERQAFLDFSLPILEMPEAIFVRERQFDIHDLDTLSGKKVACVNRHITHLYLQRFPEIQCHLVNTPAEGLIALINGNADAFIYPEQIVLYLAQQLKLAPKIKVVGEPLRVLSWSMTVKKGNSALLAQLNHGITRVRKSGEYHRIYERWFGRRLFAGYSRGEVLIITAITVLLSLLAVITVGLLIHARSMRQANLALAESESKYRTLADKLPESVFLKDTDGVYVSCNQRYADSLGITPEQVVGKTDYDFHPVNAESYREGDRKIMETGKTQEFIESYVQDGKTGYIQTIKTPVYNEQGELSGVLGIFWDITHEREMQQRLASTIKEYNAITATVPDVMYKLDTEGHLSWWNETFEQVTGLNAAQLHDRHALSLIAEADRDKVASAIRETLAHGFAEVEARLLTRAGEVDYYFNGARLLDGKGTPVGLVGSGRDMSTQKEAEAHQDRLQAQLLQAQKMETIGQLTGGIAHDFNNMLASILGYGELSLQGLEAELPPDKLRSYLSEIVRSGERARDLVAQMLTFARANKGDTRPVELANLIDEISKMLRPMIPTTIELKLDIDSALPSLLADPVMIQQLLINLCINARDAMQGHGSITIHARPYQATGEVCDSCHEHIHGDYIELAVSDTGEGIEPQLITRIFEPFMTTKDVGKGTGMGLAMVHGITHDHQGHIRVESRPGHTRFMIYLPASDMVNPALGLEDGGDSAKYEYDGQQHHILVIDDEEALSELLSEMLSIQGYRVSVEHDGLKALQAYTSRPHEFDLVITDQTMPGLTGSEIAKKMLVIRPELPIVLCTGFSDDIDEKGAKGIGIRAFVNKPINNQNLLRLVHQLLHP